MAPNIIQHLNPIWRDKADFIIGAWCSNKQIEGKPQWEQLWSRRITDNTFEICCIPFYVYNISLGDVAKTDKDFMITEIIKHSTHKTFRIWLGASKSSQIRDEVIRVITDLSCSIEWYSDNLLAVDASDDEKAQIIANWLYQKEQVEELTYETGQI